MKTPHVLQALFISCLTTTMSFGAGRSLPDTAKIVPPETVVLINIADINSLQNQFQKTNLYKLYKDPSMAAFFNAFNTKWQKNLRESEDEMAKMIADVNTIPSGRLAAAFILNEKSKATDEPVFLIVSQWGKDFKNIKAAVERAVKKAVDGGARQEKETVRGHEIVTITEKEGTPTKSQEPATESESKKTMKPSLHRFVGISDEGESTGNVIRHNEDNEERPANAADTPNAISYCFLDDALIAADDKEALKFMLSRIEGSAGQSLADNVNYQSTMAAVGPFHDIDIYVNIEQIVKAIAAQDNSGQMNTQIANFGLDNVVSLGAAVSVGRASGTPAGIKGLLKISGAKKGVMKMLEPQNAAVQVPKFVDASSAGLSVFNIDIKNAYDELFRMMSGMSPGFAAGMNAPLAPGDENGQGRIELKKDILDYLGSQVILASGIKKPFAAGTDPTKFLCAITITDHVAIEKSLAILHGSWSGGKPDSKRELFGHTIYIIGMDRFPFMMRPAKTPMADVAEKSQQPAPKLAFTVMDTHLILGSEENVAQAIRLINSKDSGSLAAMPWFARAKSAIPGSVGVAGLTDNRPSYEYLWWILKETGKVRSNTDVFDPTQMALSGISEYLKFSLLPDFDAVKKYFGVTAQYVVSRPDGFYFEMQELDLKAE